MLATVTEPYPELAPFVGNGYGATQLHSQTLYISGLYNGLGTSAPSHRARLPSPLNTGIANQKPVASAMDFERGVFYTRGVLTADGQTAVEQRWYASQARRSVLVWQQDTGPFSTDINMTESTEGGATIIWGPIATPEFPGAQVVNAAMATAALTESVPAPPGLSRAVFITTLATDIPGDCADIGNPLSCALADYNTAVAANASLYDEHIAAWAAVWSSRIEVAGNTPLAAAINASAYYILASIRPDWPWGLSPGGLGSNGYNGHV
jgi:protein-glucosylgalactosylhydroxylysine glucosidase